VLEPEEMKFQSSSEEESQEGMFTPLNVPLKKRLLFNHDTKAFQTPTADTCGSATAVITVEG